jgi:hypothetical protein
VKRALALIALFACAATARAATDVLTIGSATVPKATVSIPVYVRDVATTRLGADKTASLRIQALAFRIKFAPAGSVTSASFTRVGVLAGRTPLFETVLPFSNGVGYVASFAESTNALPFNTSTAAPGQLIGNLSITMGAGVVPGNVITASFDTAHTALSNQAGTVTETYANAGLTLQDGLITVSCPAPATINASTGVYAGSTENYASVEDQGPGVTYNWALTNGTITSGQGTRAIRYTAGASGTVGIDVTVTATGCSGSSSHADVAIISRPAGASMLYLLTPCRVYDSRNSMAIPNGQERPITVAGVCGVPAGAKAVTANITVIAPPTDGWMGAFPSDLPWPGTSTINYRANRTRANNAVVPLSSDGRLTLKNSGSTLHFIVDVTGYFK